MPAYILIVATLSRIFEQMHASRLLLWHCLPPCTCTIFGKFIIFSHVYSVPLVLLALRRVLQFPDFRSNSVRAD